MNHNSNPLDYLIELCETAVNTGKWNLTRFIILNAKDELRRLRENKKELAIEAYNANQFAVDEMNRNLDYKNVAWARINERGDLFDLTLHYNRFCNEDALISLYLNEKEFRTKHGKLSKQTL
jgi:hypothetical protein